MDEIWKDIKNFKNFYQCSNFGRIRSLDRFVTDKNNSVQFKKGQIIKPRLNKNGYWQAGLYINNSRKTMYIHKLIAETFIENPNNYETVNHKDGNKNNNNADNLEWVSYSENNKHSYNQLNRTKVKVGGKPVKVFIIDTYIGRIYYFDSIANTSTTIGLSHTQINRYIYSNKRWKGRYIFQTDNNKCVENSERVS